MFVLYTETARQEGVRYTPPTIHIIRNVLPAYIRITRHCQIEQMTYADWYEELEWFKCIKSILDGLELDEETRGNVMKSLGDYINRTYVHYREMKPVALMMDLDEVRLHERWARNVYRTIIRSHLPKELARCVVGAAYAECQSRYRTLRTVPDN
jgi:hypothetical protein